MKKSITLILMLAMMFSLVACSRDGGGGELSTSNELTKEDVISICIPSHPSWPYQENWKVWEYIEEGVGATLDIMAVPETDYGTKITLMFTDAKTLPDIVVFGGKLPVDTYSAQGALVAVEDVEKHMPTMTAFYNSLSDDEYNQKVHMSRSADGKQYFIPNFGRDKATNVRAWLYRKDIFDKHNLKVPTTYDELYEVCKTLKGIYPDSYPYCIRSKLANLDVTGPSWKPYWVTGIYYDHNSEKWCYGAIEDTMREVIEFHSKMIEEGLLTPNFITIDTASWEELITTDRGFIMPEYQTRIDYFNSIARDKNLEFKLSAMVPPVADKENGVNMVNKYNVDPDGLSICNTGNEERIINAARYIDWLYTDEARELVSWGKEGETYELVDGKKKYITDAAGTQIQTLYGFNSNGSFSLIDSEAVTASESSDIVEVRELVLEHTIDRGNPEGNVAFTDDEMSRRTAIWSDISTYANEMIAKFILKQEPMSKFDEFVDNIKNMGIDELLDIYDTAYNRMLGK